MLAMKKQIEELTGMVVELRNEVVRNKECKEGVANLEKEMGDRMKKMEDNSEVLATRVVGVEKGLEQMSIRLDGVARGVGHLESEVATVRTTTTDTNNKLDLLLQRTGRGDMEHQVGGGKARKRSLEGEDNTADEDSSTRSRNAQKLKPRGASQDWSGDEAQEGGEGRRSSTGMLSLENNSRTTGEGLRHRGGSHVDLQRLDESGSPRGGSRGQ